VLQNFPWLPEVNWGDVGEAIPTLRRWGSRQGGDRHSEWWRMLGKENAAVTAPAAS
jgi:hypothetical protein